MDKKSNVRVVGFPKANYTKKWLDALNDKERSEAALADGNAAITQLYLRIWRSIKKRS